MLRLLIQLWPAFIPIALFILCYVLAVRRAKKQPEPIIPKLRDGPWFITIVSTILIMIVCIFVYELLGEKHTGDYVPAEYIDGKLVDGAMVE